MSLVRSCKTRGSIRIVIIFSKGDHSLGTGIRAISPFFRIICAPSGVATSDCVRVRSCGEQSRCHSVFIIASSNTRRGRILKGNTCHVTISSLIQS